MEHGTKQCDATTISKNELQSVVIAAINKCRGNRDDMILTLEKNICSAVSQTDEFSVENTNIPSSELQKELLKKANSEQDFNEVVEEVYRLRDLKQDVLTGDTEREGLKQRVTEMVVFLHQQPTKITEYDEQLVRRLIERVTDYEERCIVEFKSGMSQYIDRRTE